VRTELIRVSSADTPTDRWTADRLRDEKGYEPEHWPLITALQGDAADNVIGIPGIGPKRALAMLKRYDFNLFDAVAAEQSDYLEQVCRVNLQLVNLRDIGVIQGVEVPAPVLLPRMGTPPGDAFLVFLRYYGLSGAIRRFEEGRLWREPVIPGRPLRFTSKGG
jgi:hypothetical protein